MGIEEYRVSVAAERAELDEMVARSFKLLDRSPRLSPTSRIGQLCVIYCVDQVVPCSEQSLDDLYNRYSSVVEALCRPELIPDNISVPVDERTDEDYSLKARMIKLHTDGLIDLNKSRDSQRETLLTENGRRTVRAWMNMRGSIVA